MKAKDAELHGAQQQLAELQAELKQLAAEKKVSSTCFSSIGTECFVRLSYLWPTMYSENHAFLSSYAILVGLRYNYIAEKYS